jgi:hypothetical protein
MAVATGERRIVSVLVADVVGSTAIGEKLGPERSKFLIDEVMRIMTEQVRRFDGTVAQLVGDEMLALFGVPVSHEDDAERALRAALAIRALAQYAQEVEAAYGSACRRIGVNTGPGRRRPRRDGGDGATLQRPRRHGERRLALPGDRRQRRGVIGPTTSARSRPPELEDMGAQDSRASASRSETFRVTKVLESSRSCPASRSSAATSS